MDVVILVAIGGAGGYIMFALLQRDLFSMSFPSSLFPHKKSIVEALLLPAGGCLLAILLAAFPPSGRVFSLTEPELLAGFAYGFYLYFLVNLFACVLSGFRFDIAPNLSTYPGIGVGLIAGLFVPGFSGTLSREFLPGNIDSFLHNALGAIVGFGFLWLLRFFYRKYRGQEGLGLGVVKLSAMIGAFLGPRKLLVALMLASLFTLLGALALLQLRSIWGKAPREVNFSGGIAAAALVSCFLGDYLWMLWESFAESLAR